MWEKGRADFTQQRALGHTLGSDWNENPSAQDQHSQESTASTWLKPNTNTVKYAVSGTIADTFFKQTWKTTQRI